MAYLSDKTITALADAACEIALDEQALVDCLPPPVASKMDLRPSSASRILVILHRLNHWQPPPGEVPPLCTFLRNAVFLAGGRAQAAVFAGALAEIERQGRRAAEPPAARPSPQTFHGLWMKRAKRFYASHGYEVVPPETEHSTAFYAYRGVEFVDVVAVAEDDVEEAIAAVTRLVEEIQPNEPFAAGYVVITARTKEQRRADEAKVRSASLRPLDYNDLPPIGQMELDNFVDRQHAWVLAEPEPPDDADLGDAPLEDLVRALLCDGSARILYLNAANRRTAWHLRRRLASACSQDFTNKPEAPAPLLLSLSPKPPAELKELVAEAFRAHDVRWSPLALPSLLENGSILPIFAAADGVPSAPCWALVKQAVIGKAKAVLLGWEEDATPIPSLARRLNVPLTGIRVVAA